MRGEPGTGNRSRVLDAFRERVHPCILVQAQPSGRASVCAYGGHTIGAAAHFADELPEHLPSHATENSLLSCERIGGRVPRRGSAMGDDTAGDLPAAGNDGVETRTLARICFRHTADGQHPMRSRLASELGPMQGNRACRVKEGL